MEKISYDYFQTMSIRHIWGYILNLQDTSEKMENRVYELIDQNQKLFDENKILKKNIKILQG